MGNHYVIFDGTSAFVISESEYAQYADDPTVKIEFTDPDIDKCQDYADDLNIEIAGF